MLWAVIHTTHVTFDLIEIVQALTSHSSAVRRSSLTTYSVAVWPNALTQRILKISRERKKRQSEMAMMPTPGDLNYMFKVFFFFTFKRTKEFARGDLSYISEVSEWSLSFFVSQDSVASNWLTMEVKYLPYIGRRSPGCWQGVSGQTTGTSPSLLNVTLTVNNSHHAGTSMLLGFLCGF